jgi:predicted DNA-binding protein YlxM (UPF0122 family)
VNHDKSLHKISARLGISRGAIRNMLKKYRKALEWEIYPKDALLVS